jgi:hypothetical protein
MLIISRPFALLQQECFNFDICDLVLVLVIPQYNSWDFLSAMECTRVSLNPFTAPMHQRKHRLLGLSLKRDLKCHGIYVYGTGDFQ